MEKTGKITKVIANFVSDEVVITDFYLTKCFEDGDEVTQNFITISLMMEAWCNFMLQGYTCTTNVEKELYGNE